MDRYEEPGVCSGSPPAIARRGPHGRAWLVDTPYEVWEVVAVLERRGSPGDVAAETGLSNHQVRLALEFWERCPEEVDAALAEERAPAAGAAGPRGARASGVSPAGPDAAPAGSRPRGSSP